MMENQPPIGLPSVQVTYRIFLRDMLPGWIFTMGAVYIFLPQVFKSDLIAITVILVAFVWSPVIGLLVNTMGYMTLEWILDSKAVRFLYSRIFMSNANRVDEYMHKIINLVYGSHHPSGEKTGDDRQLFADRSTALIRRAHFILRVAGWSERDELVERIHGILQTARSLVFLAIVAAVVFRENMVALPFSHSLISVAGWQVFLLFATVFLVVACFLAQYAKLVDLQLLYELIVTNRIPVSAIRGEVTNNTITVAREASS